MKVNFVNENTKLYVCDRKACERCTDECYRTTDVRHAVNPENYVEFAELKEANYVNKNN